jgi:glycosyltransferase involved in cell wall biosynthesis
MLSKFPPPPPGKTGWPWTEESPQLPETMPDGKPWPKISIVTPSYNQGQFLEETIRSVVLQGYPNLEYLIIDGGSTDNSVEIIKKYESWLTYWVSESDQGQTHAINKGFILAKGDKIAYLNSDDTYLPGVIGYVMLIFEQNPDSEIVYGDCNVIDETSTIIEKIIFPDLNLEKLIDGTTFGQPAGFIHRSVIEKVGMFNENLTYVMDYDYWLRSVVNNVRFLYVNKVLGNLRMWSSCKSVGQEWEMALEQLSLLEQVMENPEAKKVPVVYWSNGLCNASLWAARSAFNSERLNEGIKYLMKAIKYAPDVVKRGSNAIGAELAKVFVRKYGIESISKSKALLKALQSESGVAAILAHEILGWTYARMADRHWERKECSMARRHMLKAIVLKPALLSDRYYGRLFFKMMLGALVITG